MLRLRPPRGYHLLADIAREMGVTKQSVHQRLKARGITPVRSEDGPMLVTTAQRAEILRDRAAGRPPGNGTNK